MNDHTVELKALRAYPAQGFEQTKSGWTNSTFLAEVEKGITAATEGRLLDHHELKAIWEAKRLKISELPK